MYSRFFLYVSSTAYSPQILYINQSGIYGEISLKQDDGPLALHAGVSGIWLAAYSKRVCQHFVWQWIY
jgi:hypothetical protein